MRLINLLLSNGFFCALWRPLNLRLIRFLNKGWPGLQKACVPVGLWYDAFCQEAL